MNTETLINKELKKLGQYNEDWYDKVTVALSVIRKLVGDIHRDLYFARERLGEGGTLVSSIESAIYQIDTLSRIAEESIPKDEVNVMVNIQAFIERYFKEAAARA